METGVWRIESPPPKKRKEGFLTSLAIAIKKDPTASIRKLANELKVHEKTVKTGIKYDLSPNFNPFDYAIWGVLKRTSHLNIGSLKTSILEEWNSVQIIYFECIKIVSKECWSNNWKKKKWWPDWVNLLFYMYLLISLFIY